MLMCMFIGDASIFGVKVNVTDTIAELMDKIKQKNPSKVDSDISDVMLYIAKKENGNWLKTTDFDRQQLKNGNIPKEIREMLKKKENKMDPTYQIGNPAFGIPNENDTEDGDIHVLVEVPKRWPLIILGGRICCPLSKYDWLATKTAKKKSKRTRVVTNEGAAEVEKNRFGKCGGMPYCYM